MALFDGQRQTLPEGERTSQERPPRHVFSSFWRLCLTFFNTQKWDQHEEELHEQRQERRLFFEYLGISSLVMLLVLLIAVFKDAPETLESHVQDGLMLLAVHPNDKTSKDFPPILFIDVDEESWRETRWGGGEPRAVPLKALAGLIGQTVEQGAKYILVDFVVDGPTDKDMEDFYEAVKKIVDKSILEERNCHFLFVRSIRTPLNSGEQPLIRPSFALDRLMAEYPDRVHGVSTNFVRTDKVVRHWRLWESACLEKPGKNGDPGEKVWAVLPAAQLLIQSLEKEKPIPWTPESLLAPAQTGNKEVSPLAADERCGQISADFHIGHWLKKTFDRCYQQDYFTGQDCEAERPDCEREESGLKKRANRVFFYWSDFYWGEGQDRRPLRHLYHVPALELWRLSERQAQGEGVEADTRPLKRLKQFNERVNPAKQNAPGIAIIGASYAASHDFHETPPGVEMPGILLLANAVATMTLHGPIQEMGYWASALVTVAMIVLFSASLTWVTVWFGDWFDGWFSVRRARLVAWFQARAERDGRFRLFGVPVPQWLCSRCAGLADWTPNAQTPAFWLIILLFFLLTWFLLVEWKTWFNFTLTISFMYCLLEVRSAAMWWALALFGVIQLLL